MAPSYVALINFGRAAVVVGCGALRRGLGKPKSRKGQARSEQYRFGCCCFHETLLEIVRGVAAVDSWAGL